VIRSSGTSTVKAALLALLALAGLKSRLGLALVWVFNVWGTDGTRTMAGSCAASQ
jgi:hypothetical protein